MHASFHYAGVEIMSTYTMGRTTLSTLAKEHNSAHSLKGLTQSKLKLPTQWVMTE
jgi:hypothetical protein